MSDSWALTESDAGVFTCLLERLGVEGLEFRDVWSLDSQEAVVPHSTLAWIFLFKHLGRDAVEQGQVDAENFTGVYAHQTVNNACATIAILNACLSLDPDLGSTPFTLGQRLTDMRTFFKEAGCDAYMCGESIASNQDFRQIHNSLATTDAFDVDEKDKSAVGDAFHFVAYLPVKTALGLHVWELDGLQKGPIRHDEVVGDWTKTAAAVIQRRIASYDPKELKFSLMALGGNREKELSAALDTVDDPAISAELYAERLKRETWAFENSLRGPSVNLIGFIHSLLLNMAKAGSLSLDSLQ